MPVVLERWLMSNGSRCTCFEYVYVVRRPDGLYKIGMSVKPERRLRAISSIAGLPLLVMLIVPTPDAKSLERQLHRTFQSRRVQGEWFRLDRGQFARLEDLCSKEERPKHHDACTEATTPPLRLANIIMTREPEWVSVSEAARRLNRSVSTIRRMIESGQIVGEREPRGFGSSLDRYRVRLPGVEPTPLHPDASDSVEVSFLPPEASQPPTPPTGAPALTTGLLEIISADRETIATLHAENADLRERVGRAETRADLAEAEIERLRRPWWKRWRYDA